MPLRCRGIARLHLNSCGPPSPAVSTVEVSVNLDPNDAGLPGGAAGFDHLDPVNTSNFQTGIRVFDEQGNPRNVLVYFRKDDAATN